jgi:hypothetical protein
MTRIALRSLSALLLLAAACQGNDDIGKPCEKADQCAEGLICDVHDGKGTCQEPHHHGPSSESETDDHGTTAHDHDTAHDHGTTAHDHGTTAHEPTTGADTSDTTTG